ncbi:MAG TPA: hypothetical protein ENI05_02195 [Porticoccus sp.]|nr:hypothetical protein [Porticoccus sp.]
MAISGYFITRQKTAAETASYRKRRGISTPEAGPSVSPEARTALQAAMSQYEVGGGFGKGIEAGLERGRVKSVASGMQSLVSSGLANTTMAAGLGKKYESEVAAPTRARMEETRASAISSLQAMLAQMEQGGYQAQLGRQFTASQSRSNRSFAPVITPFGQSRTQPSESPRTTSTPRSASIRPSSAPARQRLNVTGAATNAYRSKSDWTPGGYMGAVNGERWVYGQQGQPVRG